MNENDVIRASILEMSNGAILERVDREIGPVIDNILDPNTDPVKKRKLTVTLELKPDSERRTIQVMTTAKSTLVPTTPIVTNLYIAGGLGGELEVVEMVPQTPGQLSISGTEQESPKLLKFHGA